MRRSTDRIITTHAGSLSRPSDLIALNRARAAGEMWDDGAYQKCLSSAVADVIRKQQELGVDVPDDGELMTHAIPTRTPLMPIITRGPNLSMR